MCVIKLSLKGLITKLKGLFDSPIDNPDGPVLSCSGLCMVIPTLGGTSLPSSRNA